MVPQRSLSIEKKTLKSYIHRVNTNQQLTDDCWSYTENKEQFERGLSAQTGTCDCLVSSWPQFSHVLDLEGPSLIAPLLPLNNRVSASSSAFSISTSATTTPESVDWLEKWRLCEDLTVATEVNDSFPFEDWNSLFGKFSVWNHLYNLTTFQLQFKFSTKNF